MYHNTCKTHIQNTDGWQKSKKGRGGSESEPWGEEREGYDDISEALCIAIKRYQAKNMENKEMVFIVILIEHGVFQFELFRFFQRSQVSFWSSGYFDD